MQSQITLITEKAGPSETSVHTSQTDRQYHIP